MKQVRGFFFGFFLPRCLCGCSRLPVGQKQVKSTGRCNNCRLQTKFRRNAARVCGMVTASSGSCRRLDRLASINDRKEAIKMDGNALLCSGREERFSGVWAPPDGLGASGLDHSQLGTRSLMEVNFEPHALSMQWSWVRKADLKGVKKINN